ncbi:hypothetical protein ACQ4N7_26290 [Nodosilinea sp. AN01ver1]|uniref:hypothetical protein n=1 Tax=Nodosilinea sp. AN01ver1 TaxID=3423362 RepID=UPI003D314858
MSTIQQQERAELLLAEYESKLNVYGESALLFAYHAALPVALTPDLLHLIRINFFLDPPDESEENWKPLPYWMEFDFLVSSICNQVDDGLYEIEPTVRDILLEKLVLTYKYTKRIQEIASLLWQYTTNHLDWENREGLERAQQLTALNFLAPNKALEWLETAETQDSEGEELEREWYVVMRQEVQRRTEIIQNQNFHSDEYSSSSLRVKYDELVQTASSLPESHLNILILTLHPPYAKIPSFRVRPLDRVSALLNWSLTSEEYSLDLAEKVLNHLISNDFDLSDLAEYPSIAQRFFISNWVHFLNHENLEELVKSIRVPQSIIPPLSAAPTTIVFEIMGWVESSLGCGIEVLVRELERIDPRQNSIDIRAIASSKPQQLKPKKNNQKWDALFEDLCALIYPVFGQIVFLLAIPAGIIPEDPAPLEKKAAALLDWAENPVGCGLDTVTLVLEAVPSAFNIATDSSLDFHDSIPSTLRTKIILERLKLLKSTLALSQAKFQDLVFLSNISYGYLPGSTTSLSDRAIALLEWADKPSGCGLEEIERILNDVNNEVPSTEEGSQQDRSLSRLKYRSLLNKLSNLTKKEFEEIILGANPPKSVLYSDSSPLPERAISLLKWAKSSTGCGLEEIEKLLSTVRNSSKFEFPQKEETGYEHASKAKRIDLFDSLIGFPQPQFEQILFSVSPPPGMIPTHHSSLASRVVALLEWAESPNGCGLENIENLIDQIVNPHSFNIPPDIPASLNFHRRQLLDILSNLPEAAFETIWFNEGPLEGSESTFSSDQSSRAEALLAWAESPSGRGLDAIERALDGFTR